MRTDLALACALGVLLLALGLLRLTPQVAGNYHDDGIYISTARALAEGQGYRLINLPEEPPQTKYPVLYPAVLSVLWTLWPDFPDNLLAFQVLSLLAAAAAIALAYLHILRMRYASRPQAVAACLICACSPSLLYYSTQVLSEAMFSLLLVAAIWRVDAQASPPHRNELLTGVIIALPFLCRTLGGLLVPLALWVLYRAGARMAPLLTGAAAVIAPWSIWVAYNALGHAAAGPQEYYTIQDYVDWWRWDGSMLKVYVVNLVWLLSAAASFPLQGLVRAGVWHVLPFAALGVLIWRELIIGMRPGLLWKVLAAYAAVLVLWPWPPGRFLVPLLPYIALALTRVACRSLERFTKRHAAAWGRAALAVVLASNLLLFAVHIRLVWQTGYPYEQIPGQPAAWRDYQQLFEWVRTNSEPTDVIAAGLDSMVFLYTQRRAIRPYLQRPTALYYGDPRPPVGSSDDLRANLQQYQPRYLLQHPMPGFAAEEPLFELIRQTRQRWPSCLAQVYRGEADHRFAAFRVNLQACGHAD